MKLIKLKFINELGLTYGYWCRIYDDIWAVTASMPSRRQYLANEHLIKSKISK